ncbi:MSCRAMM family protein [Anaerostipes caccae]|uniref:MSCRAMM family protein n=2 Tax=Anaerostipes caccae TaxID=105841 RepID=UPI001D0960BF|nr:SpaA isopeptide-forming pilin-related protein [Anaerostipes caccae]MCB6294557.1 isopeptide-forming domain-containing fimbrial protein [Anaerostipes caccae]MCB6336516.1 isopeptide-forming domain-containing fimbrial protein [Anaerostipes caccae]MCB6340677.1 isopeptide-forming domain-containing fimbrial protein [Anaerostipes caccae]MCB6354078.1 isopeptide-forming domain-containing fimbrial protein [Anaerostipes caccae]MCB6360978.1 isopeptide-forming domain-containing fimbrial protein [Anaerost
MSKKVRKSLAVLAAFVLTISFIAGSGAFTNVHAQEAETETASEQITSTTEASLATEETAAMATESVTTEQKAATESNTEAAKAESTASVTAIQKKTAVKSVKQGSDPVVTNGDFTKYLTKFAFTDHLGNPFTESHPVTKDSNVIIRYEFKIPNKETIQGGSTYILKMPNVFQLDGLSGAAQKLNKQQAGAVEEVPNWTVNNNATITVKFPKTLTQSNIEGFMEISCSVDADQLKEETIIFDLGQLEGFGQEYQTDFKPEVEKKSPEVAKKGTLNREDQTITWTVIATPDKGDNNLEGYTLIDTFDKKQVFVKGSVELDGTKTADPELTDNGWNYKFGKISNGSHTLTYKTKLTDEFFESDYKSNGAKDMSAIAANTVTIKTGDSKGEASADASVRVVRYAFWKDKNASNNIGYDDDAKKPYLGFQLKGWYDTAGRELPVTFTDKLPEGTSLMETEGQLTVKYGSGNAVKLTKAAGSTPGENEYTYDTATREFKVTLDPKYNNNFVYVNYKIWLDTEAAVKKGSVRNTAVMTVGNHVSISDYEDSSWGSGYQKGKLGLTKSGAFARVEDDNTIKWTVTVNNNPTKTVNGDIQFKDVLPEGLEYIAGSFNANYKGKNEKNVQVNGNELIFTIKDLGKNKCTITYTTRIKGGALQFTQNANGNSPAVSFKNHVFLEWDGNKQDITGTGSVNIQTFVSKKGSYNSSKDEFNWTIWLRSKGIYIHNMVVTEKLPEGHRLVEGSLKYGDKVLGTEKSADQPYYEVSGDSIIIYFPEQMLPTDKNDMTLSTVTDETKAETKPEKVSAVNEVSVRADEFKTELTAKAEVNVSYTPDVEKTTSYKKGNYVEWTVNVNKNHAVITKQKAEITDQLQPGLTYREGSVKLIDVTANNKEISGMDSDYDDVSGKIVFTFPDGLDLTHQFKVLFITDVTSATGNIKNTVTFDASAKETKVTSGSVPLILSGMNSGLTGDNIRFILNKTDAEDNAPLENVEFQLYDHNKNEVGSVMKTDNKGRIAFDAGLKYGNTYYLKETKALNDYVLDAAEHKLVIGEKESDRVQVQFDGRDYTFSLDENGTLNFGFTITNEAKRGSVLLKKVSSEDAQTLEGAEFSLYKADGELVAQGLKTDAQGQIRFDYLRLGTYYFQETKAPEGYNLDAETKYEFRINDQAAETPVVVEAENVPTKVSVIKLDAATKKALAGAELQIIQIQEDGSELIVEEWTSEEEAHAVTGKLIPGEEYILRETEAPFGYELAEDVRFTVNAGGELQTVEMYDEPSPEDPYYGGDDEEESSTSETTTTTTYEEPEDEDSYYREDSETVKTSEASSKSVTESRVSRTGDSSHTAVYAIVAVCAAGAVLLLLRKKYKK